MITKCNQSNHDEIMSYLYRDPCINLFFIGDINNSGFDMDYCETFADKRDGDIVALYLRYFNNLVITSYTQQVDQTFFDEMVQKYNIKAASGPLSTVEKLSMPNWQNEDCYFCKCTKVSNEINTEETQVASEEDIKEITDAELTVFGGDNQYEQRMIEIKQKTGRSIVIKKDGKIIAQAGSTAETKGLAMICGVYTLEAYRNQGYASMCMARLCNDLLKEGMTPCLFYNNPTAGKIYHKLGFGDIDKWALRKNIKND